VKFNGLIIRDFPEVREPMHGCEVKSFKKYTV